MLDIPKINTAYHVSCSHNIKLLVIYHPCVFFFIDKRRDFVNWDFLWSADTVSSLVLENCYAIHLKSLWKISYTQKTPSYNHDIEFALWVLFVYKTQFLGQPNSRTIDSRVFQCTRSIRVTKVIKITPPNDDYFDNISTHIVFRRFCPHSILLVPAYRNTQPKKQKFHK